MENRRSFISKTLLSSLKLMAASSGLIPLLSSHVQAELFGSIPSDLPADQSIYRLKGTVWVDGQIATIKTFVRANSLIKTSANSEIIFVVGNDAHIIRENSEVQLTSDGFIEGSLKVITGKILSVFGKRNKDELVTIETSTATIGIRGTGVYIESFEEFSYFCTCYGETEITTRFENQKENITSKHHDQPRYIYATPSNSNNNSVISEAPLINHSDQELALIEALVGRTPPFANFLESYDRPRRKY